MNSDFLVQYSDFRGDIPVFNAGPSNLSLLGSGISYPDWYNFDNAEEEGSRANGNNLQLATLVGYETGSNPNAFNLGTESLKNGLMATTTCRYVS